MEGTRSELELAAGTAALVRLGENSHREDPGKHYKDLIKAYPNAPRRDLAHRFRRIRKAREIVGEIEKRYGVNSKRNIINKEDLFRDAHEVKAPTPLKISSKGIYVEVQLPYHFMKDLSGFYDCPGVEFGELFDSKEMPEITYDRLLAFMTHHTPKLKTRPGIKLDPDERIIFDIFSDSDFYGTRSHEVKHFLDYLFTDNTPFMETAASTYGIEEIDPDKVERAHKKDIARSKTRVSLLEQDLKELGPECYEYAKKRVDAIGSLDIELIYRLNGSRESSLTGPEISFLLSRTDPFWVNETLQNAGVSILYQPVQRLPDSFFR